MRSKLVFTLSALLLASFTVAQSSSEEEAAIALKLDVNANAPDASAAIDIEASIVVDEFNKYSCANTKETLVWLGSQCACKGSPAESDTTCPGPTNALVGDACCDSGCEIRCHRYKENLSGYCVTGPSQIPINPASGGERHTVAKSTPSPTPTWSSKRHTRDQDSLFCPGGLSACPITRASGLDSGYECVDTNAELEQCGGCLANGEGKGRLTISQMDSITAADIPRPTNKTAHLSQELLA
ncbi:MAG: hypothetical protein CYPHOPRED_000734 [Cyphobasidiales sp. Tagirdzhanova-0007]|nr:MAG: hypothetical protein CYPHOPRED_000734 [Cyphobasidiales sp. Tagirdzhanova-0007]